MIPVALSPRLIAMLAGVVFLAVSHGYLYLKGRSNGAAKVEAKWEEDRARSAKKSAIELEKAYTQNAKLINDYELLRWRLEDAVKQKLASDVRAGELAVRLRIAYRNLEVSLPPNPASTADSIGTSGTGSGGDAAELDLAVNGVIQACRRDSIKLMGFQQWWEGVLRLQGQ